MDDASRKSRAANQRGTFERRVVNRLNDAILHQFGGSWQSPPVAIDITQLRTAPIARAVRTLVHQENWLLKDPRFVLTLDAWLPQLPGAQLVGSYRHPVAVAKSLQKRNQITIEDGMRLWSVYNRALIRHHQQQPFPLINFDLSVQPYLRQFACLCEILKLPFNADAASQFYNPHLVLHAATLDVEIDEENSSLLAYLTEHQVPISS